MTTTAPTSIRKAAILLRSVDTDTAAQLLAQLSPAEARALRDAVRNLGAIDADEQADVMAELRQARPVAAKDAGVELGGALGEQFAAAAKPPQPIGTPTYDPPAAGHPQTPQFDSIDTAQLAEMLQRERPQTAAVVLAALSPARAAELLAALPASLRNDAMARLAVLGETDSESLEVVERELRAWMARQPAIRPSGDAGRQRIESILALAPAEIRQSLASHLARTDRRTFGHLVAPPAAQPPTTAKAAPAMSAPEVAEPKAVPAVEPPSRQRPQIAFDSLSRLDAGTLTRALAGIDAELLSLALAGADDTLIDCIATQLPRREARRFRHQLRHLGPTRLSDVAQAQQAVADAVSHWLAARRKTLAAH